MPGPLQDPSDLMFCASRAGVGGLADPFVHDRVRGWSMALGLPADRPPSESTGSVLVTLRSSRAWCYRSQGSQKLSPAAPDAKPVPAAPLLPGADPCEARAWKVPPGTASKTGPPFTGCGAHAYSPSHRPNGSPAESCAAEARACKRSRSLPGDHARARVGCRMGPAPEP
jgi:hypothetical protein